MVPWQVQVPIGILSTWSSIQIEYCIVAMVCGDFDNSVKLLETLLIDVEGKQLLLIVKEMAVIERTPRTIAL